MINRRLSAGFCAIIFAALVAISAGAATIVEYRGDGPDRLAPHYQIAAAFATDLSTAGSNLGSLTGSANLGGSFIADASVDADLDFPDAIANNLYFSFTVATYGRSSPSLLAVTFSAGAVGTGWEIRSSLDNYATTAAWGSTFSASPNLLPYSGTIGYLAAFELRRDVTFRFYVSGQKSNQAIAFDWLRVEQFDLPASAPIVEVSGPRRIRTSKRAVTLRGYAFDDFGVAAVTYSVGPATRTARGTSNWSARVPLDSFRRNTRVKIEATDADGNAAAPRIVKIIRD